jgi:hypothetical protein
VAHAPALVHRSRRPRAGSRRWLDRWMRGPRSRTVRRVPRNCLSIYLSTTLPQALACAAWHWRSAAACGAALSPTSCRRRSTTCATTWASCRPPPRRAAWPPSTGARLGPFSTRRSARRTWSWGRTWCTSRRSPHPSPPRWTRSSRVRRARHASE